jgi:hypothetical protein
MPAEGSTPFVKFLFLVPITIFPSRMLLFDILRLIPNGAKLAIVLLKR